MKHAATVLGTAAAACLALTGPARGQQEAQPQQPVGDLLRPTLAVEEAYLDTRGRPDGLNGGESITRVSPGVRWSSRSGRLQGSLDYTAHLQYRAGRPETAGGEVKNALDAVVAAELVPNRLFVDATASVSPQAISAFGEQASDVYLHSSENLSDIATLTVSPSLRGQIGAAADYVLRLDAGATRADSSVASESENAGASLVVQSARTASTRLGWSLSATRQRVEFSNDSWNDDTRVDATAIASPIPELRLSLSAGHEWVDDSGLGERSLPTSGIGLAWTPSPRTTLAADAQERYFGHSSHVQFTHRMASSIWSYSLTRDTTSGSSADSIGRPLTLYQQLFNQTASQIPDAALRERFVLDTLRGAGRDPNEVVPGGFVTSSPSLQRRQDLSFAWLGLRSTFSVQAYSSEVRLLDPASSSDPAAAEPVTQRGYSAALSHRLTQQTTISFSGSRQMTRDTPSRAGTDLKSAGVNLTSQIGPRASANLSARYTVFNSQTDPYRESALLASLSLQF